MNFWDITFLIIIAIFTVKGYFKGLIWEVLRIAGLVIAYLFSHQFYGYFEKVLLFFGFSPSMSKLFGYFLLFITIFVAIVVISYMLKKFFRVIKMGWVDRLGGAGFGLLKSTVILSLLLNVVISIVPMTSGFYKTMVNSPVSSKIIALNPYIMTIIDKLSGSKKDIPFINPKKVL